MGRFAKKLITAIISAICTLFIAKGILLWLAGKEIYPDQWINSMIGLAEVAVAANPAGTWVLLGLAGLVGLAIGPGIHEWGINKFTGKVGQTEGRSEWQQEWNDLAETRYTFWKLVNQVYDGWSPSDHAFSEVIRKAHLPIELPLDDARAFPEWANQFNPIDADEYAAALDQLASEVYPRDGISARSLSGSDFKTFDNARQILSKFWDKWGRQSESHSELVKKQNFLASAAELKLLTFLEIARARWITTGQSAKNGLFQLARRANG
ncbi:MAG: hypothetical protein IIA07_11050 [Proteobacteria bacterium]|nr:hypothetical protein [Pseudomonadota bacterium]